MGMIYAYFDESGKHVDHPVVTFCGVCAPKLSVEGFDNAWNELLRQYQLRALHMVKVLRTKKFTPNTPAVTNRERIEALKPFADCINEHFELGLIEAWDVKGFKSISKNARAKLGNPDDPYYIAFTRGILELLNHFGEEHILTLVCDDDQQTAWDCYRHFRGVTRVHDLARKRIAALCFANDEHFPALQAADMIAFLARLEAKYRFYGIRYSYHELLHYLTRDEPTGRMKWRAGFFDETQLKGLSQALER